MYCDSAYHYSKEQKIRAFGNIKISQADSLILTGNKLTYYGKKEKADIEGNVILSDKFIVLKTEQIFYDFKTDIAFYPKSGIISQKNKKIQSKKRRILFKVSQIYFY